MKTIIVLAITATTFAAIAGTIRFGQDQSLLSFPYWVNTPDTHTNLTPKHGNGSKTIGTSCRSWF